MTQLEQQTMYREVRMPLGGTPPGAARVEIDQKHIVAGWVIQDIKRLNIYETLEDVVPRRNQNK